MKFLLLIAGFISFTNCAHKPQTINAEVDIAYAVVGKAYYEAYNSRDIQAQLGLMTDNVTYVTNSGRTIHGKDGYRKYTEGLFAEINEKTIDLKYYVDSSQSVLVTQGTAEGIYEKSSAGMRAAHGQKYKIPFVEIFEFEGGKIRKLSTYYNEQLWKDQIKKE